MQLVTWMKFLWEVVRPAPTSWVVLGLPLLLLAVGVVVLRASRLKPAGAWRATGVRWSWLAGVVLLSVAVAYLIAAFAGGAYVQRFHSRLTKLALEVDRRTVALQLRDLGMRASEQDLRDVLGGFVRNLKDDERYKFVQSFVQASLGRSVTVHYDLLYWPPEKVEEYKRSNAGATPMVLATEDLPYDVGQVEFLKSADYAGLNRALRPGQWAYLSRQFIDPLDQSALVSLLESIGEIWDSTDKSDSLLGRMVEVVLGGGEEPAAIAWRLGWPQGRGAIAALIRNISWIRDLAWVLLYVLAGCRMLVAGQQIVREGRPDPFNVQGKAVI